MTPFFLAGDLGACGALAESRVLMTRTLVLPNGSSFTILGSACAAARNLGHASDCGADVNAAYSWASVPDVPSFTIAGAILLSGDPRFWSQDKNAMPQPVLVAFWSVLSVLLTKSGIPFCAQSGAVAKSASALLATVAAHQRESASPVL